MSTTDSESVFRTKTGSDSESRPCNADGSNRRQDAVNMCYCFSNGGPLNSRTNMLRAFSLVPDTMVGCAFTNPYYLFRNLFQR